MLIHSSRMATNHMQGFLCFCFSISRFAKKKAPIYFLAPQKAKNDDKVTFLERISEKYLVTFGNFCTFQWLSLTSYSANSSGPGGR